MKTGVLLVTLGGPRSLDEVPIFLKRFTGADLPPHIVNIVTERYKKIGGFSPLPSITEEQANLLGKLLPGNYICLPAFRYANPSIEESIEKAYNNNIERLVFFILSPFFTSVTTGNYMERAKQFVLERRLPIPIIYVHSWYKNESFINCWLEKINNEATYDKDCLFIFSAHSLPEKLASEPYKNQIEECSKKIAERANLKRWMLAWQSVPSSTKEPWIGPTVEEIIDKAVVEGFKSIVQIPVGFTADHIETLYDIDIVHSEYARTKGLLYKRISSLNTDKNFILTIYEILKNQLGEL